MFGIVGQKRVAPLCMPLDRGSNCVVVCMVFLYFVRVERDAQQPLGANVPFTVNCTPLSFCHLCPSRLEHVARFHRECAKVDRAHEVVHNVICLTQWRLSLAD